MHYLKSLYCSTVEKMKEDNITHCLYLYWLSQLDEHFSTKWGGGRRQEEREREREREREKEGKRFSFRRRKRRATDFIKYAIRICMKI